MEIPTRHNYADEEAWPLDKLKHHARSLIWEQDIAPTARRVAELELQIGHAVFEIHVRTGEAIDV